MKNSILLRVIIATVTFIALCIALSLPALSAEKSASANWVRATQNTDGTTLTSSEITGHGVVCAFTATGASSSVPCTVTPNSFAGSVSSGTLALTYPAIGGRACVQLTTIAGARVSDPTPINNGACVDLPAVKPNPPSGVTVTVTVALNLRTDESGKIVLAASESNIAMTPQ